MNSVLGAFRHSSPRGDGAITVKAMQKASAKADERPKAPSPDFNRRVLADDEALPVKILISQSLNLKSPNPDKPDQKG